MPLFLLRLSARGMSLFQALRRGETSGQTPRSLLELPRTVCERLDGSHPMPERPGEKDARVSMRLLELSELLKRQRGRRASPSDAPAFRDLVADIGSAAIDSQRTAFLACRGDVLLLHLLHLFFLFNSYCLIYTSPSPRDTTLSRMPSSA